MHLFVTAAFVLTAAHALTSQSAYTSEGETITLDCSSCGKESAACVAAQNQQPTQQGTQEDVRPPMLVVLAYHKTGTVWWEQTFLWNQSAHLGVQWVLEPFPNPVTIAQETDVIAIGNPSVGSVLQVARQLEIQQRQWRAIVMVRDPRDSIVSGWHYHKWYEFIKHQRGSHSRPIGMLGQYCRKKGWALSHLECCGHNALDLQDIVSRTHETWAHEPKQHWAKWAGQPEGLLSLQDVVNMVDKSTGLMVELDVFEATFARMCSMLAWAPPQMLVIKYEDLWKDPAKHFRMAIDFLYGLWDPRQPSGAPNQSTPMDGSASTTSSSDSAVMLVAKKAADALYADAMAYTQHQRQLRAAKQATAASKASQAAKLVQRLESRTDGRADQATGKLSIHIKVPADAHSSADALQVAGNEAVAVDGQADVKVQGDLHKAGVDSLLTQSSAHVDERPGTYGHLQQQGPAEQPGAPDGDQQGNYSALDQHGTDPPSQQLERHADGRVKADVSRHNRRGEPGEWVELFEQQHRSEFKRQFGELVVALGYAKDNNWRRRLHHAVS